MKVARTAIQRTFDVKRVAAKVSGLESSIRVRSHSSLYHFRPVFLHEYQYTLIDPTLSHSHYLVEPLSQLRNLITHDLLLVELSTRHLYWASARNNCRLSGDSHMQTGDG